MIEVIKKLIDRFIAWRDQDIYKFAQKPPPFQRCVFVTGHLDGKRYKIKVSERWYEDQRGGDKLLTTCRTIIGGGKFWQCPHCQGKGERWSRVLGALIMGACPNCWGYGWVAAMIEPDWKARAKRYDWWKI